ncbi:type VI secretion system tube protein TssD [Tenacibaculum mesophilum]|uniref:type VI secretion system tube protein TssD n=1 Tax=Tenacibaculum mesophilum TaxID=104268 RepID=UPI0024922832|nr:type VI secretion system tube protein TssD [Tenacibaculum mesophilum]
MNIKAKLFICGEERELLTTNLNYNRLTDWNGKPTSALLGGTISVTFESEMYDDTFVDWIKSDRRGNKKIRHPFNLYQLRDGKIVFYKDEFDGVELFQYNFQDGVLVNYYEAFDNQKGMYVTLTISPAMQDYRFFNNSTDWRRKSTTRYIKPWQESFIPPIKETPYKAKTNDNRIKITKYTIKNTNNEEIEEYFAGDTIVLHVETINAIGKTITLNLNDKSYDFKYKNTVLKDDILKDYVINSNLEKITLEVIVPEKEEIN